jgi:hypothetical protein
VKLTLTKLVVENFKGIRELSIEFTDTTNIYGANATGKTSIQDAFTWLLFNKDAEGNAPGSDNFREKPLGRGRQGNPQPRYQRDRLFRAGRRALRPQADAARKLGEEARPERRGLPREHIGVLD